MALTNLVDRLGTKARVVAMTGGSALRPCLCIAGSVVAFGLLIERAGFLAAVTSTVLLASLGSRQLSAREALTLAVAVAAAMAALFVGLLDQPFNLLASF